MKPNKYNSKQKISNVDMKGLSFEKLKQLSTKSPERILLFFDSIKEELPKILDSSPFSIEFLVSFFSLISKVYNDKITNKSITQIIKNNLLIDNCAYFNTILHKIEITEENCLNILFIIDNMLSLLLAVNEGQSLEIEEFLSKIEEKDDNRSLYRNIQNKIRILKQTNKEDNNFSKDNSIASIETIKLKQLIPTNLDFFDSSFSITESNDNSILSNQNKIQFSYTEHINSLLSTESEICYKLLSNVVEKHNSKLSLSSQEKKVFSLFDNFTINDVTFNNTSITFVIKFDPKIPFDSFLNNRTLIAIYDEQSRQIILSKISLPVQRICIKSPITVEMLHSNINSIRFLLKTIHNKSCILLYGNIYYQFSLNLMKRYEQMLSSPFSQKFIDILINNNLKNNTKLPYEFDSPNYELDQYQQNAFLYILNSAVSVVLGDTGTGKTYLASVVADYYLYKSDYRILYLSNTKNDVEKFLSYFINDYKKDEFIYIIDPRTKPHNISLKKMTLREVKKKHFDNFNSYNSKLMKEEISQLNKEISSFYDIAQYPKYKETFKEEINQIISDLFQIITSITNNVYKLSDYEKNSESIFNAWIGKNSIDELLSIFPDIKKEDYNTIKEEYFNNFTIEDEFSFEEVSQSKVEEEEFEENNIEQLLSKLNVNESKNKVKESNDDIHLCIKNIFDKNNVWELGPSVRDKVANLMYSSTFSLSNSQEDTINKYIKLSNELKQIQKQDDINAIYSRRVSAVCYDSLPSILECVEDLEYDIIIIDNAEHFKERDVLPLLTADTKKLIMISHFCSKLIFDNNFPFLSLDAECSQKKENTNKENVEELIEGKEGNVHYVIPNKYIVVHDLPVDNYINSLKSALMNQIRFIVSFAIFLINKLNYALSQISICALDRRQIGKIQKILNERNRNDIKVVSSYELERTDIILISLPIPYNRNQLTVTPRDLVNCFAKANLGAYAFGNLDFLIANEKGSKWKQFKNDNKDIIGQSLPMVCKQHRMVITVQKEKDLKSVFHCDDMFESHLMLNQNVKEKEMCFESPCSHSKEYFKYSEKYEGNICTFPCGCELKCGHKCKGNCSECIMGTLHKNCDECQKEKREEKLIERFEVIERGVERRKKGIDDETIQNIYMYNFLMVKALLENELLWTEQYKKEIERKINNLYEYTRRNSEIIRKAIVESNFCSDAINKRFLLNE